MIDRESVAANDDKSVFLWFVYALWVLFRVAVRLAIPAVLVYVVLQLLGCTPQVHDVRPEYSASVVDIVDAKHSCTGFAVATARGARIVTAAHCISGPVRYFDGDGPSYEALTDVIDSTTDTAYLVPSTVLQVLQRDVPVIGQPVHVTSTMGTMYGTTQDVAGRYYTTDLDIWLGWSGSPVLNAAGDVVGVVIRCVDNQQPIKGCLRYSGIYVGLVGPDLGTCHG